MASLHDAYELGGIAGHGRTTLVRLAVRRGDCQPVALKQLRMEHSIDPDKRGRFIKQYRRACLLEHDNIESLLDIAEGDDGPVAVAEWIDGRSLQRLASLRRETSEPWHPSEVAVIASDLLAALRYAHHMPTDIGTQGMLHGGIWPGNVQIGTDGTIKLMDFGMASVWQEGREPWQDLEALRYLSADHVRHGSSAASDIYAVGAVIHELLSGQRFRGECETEAEMRAAIDQSAPPPCPAVDVPAPLERLRRGLLEPIPHPRLTLEHMIELSETIPTESGRERLRALVRGALRSASTQPDPDGTPARGIPLSAKQERDGVAKARARASAVAHAAAGSAGLGIELEQVPLGQTPRRPRVRDTQSVPVPKQREVTAAREPLFLQQTAPAQSKQAREAELRRSGLSVDHDAPTGPLGGVQSRLARELDDTAVPRALLDVIEDPGETAEVTKIPQLPEDELAEPTPAAPIAAAERPHWIRGPLGWALLGALAVGVGLPLYARCSAEPPPPSSHR